MKFEPAKLVAEVACGHLGDINLAREMVKMAYVAGADYVKFQKRNPSESIPPEMQNKPHPNKDFAYGKTYLEHRMALELSVEAHAELKEYAESLGIGYSTSVWDVTSAREIIDLKPDFIKVPSACNVNGELLYTLLNDYNGKIHISTGMTTVLEFEFIHNLIQSSPERFVVYHCTSEYPCPFDHLYLLEINRLVTKFQNTEIGFSNHGPGIASDIAAYILGVTWIERHFTYDRTAKYTDAAASLEMGGLAKLARDLKNVYKALRWKEEMSPQELEQRKKLKQEAVDD